MQAPIQPTLWMDTDSGWPPPTTVIGSGNLLEKTKVAVFCSSVCPGKRILSAMHFFQRALPQSQCYIGGFHTDVEKMCLDIILRTGSPVLVVPARSLDRFRVPVRWREPLASGKLVLASPFSIKVRRPNRRHSEFRNDYVARLAKKILIVHADEGSRLKDQIRCWVADGLDVRQIPD